VGHKRDARPFSALLAIITQRLPSLWDHVQAFWSDDQGQFNYFLPPPDKMTKPPWAAQHGLLCTPPPGKNKYALHQKRCSALGQLFGHATMSTFGGRTIASPAAKRFIQ